MSLVANLLPSRTVKEFLKSANISQSYERILSGTFLWLTAYMSGMFFWLTVYMSGTFVMTDGVYESCHL